MHKVANMVGARPSYTKAAPIIAAMRKHDDGSEQMLVPPALHYDHGTTKVLTGHLNAPQPVSRLVPDRRQSFHLRGPL